MEEEEGVRTPTYFTPHHSPTGTPKASWYRIKREEHVVTHPVHLLFVTWSWWRWRKSPSPQDSPHTTAACVFASTHPHSQHFTIEHLYHLHPHHSLQCYPLSYSFQFFPSLPSSSTLTLWIYSSQGQKSARAIFRVVLSYHDFTGSSHTPFPFH